MILLAFTCFALLILTFGTIMVLTRPSRESRTLLMRLSSIRNPRRSLKEDGEDLGIEEEEAAGSLSARISEFVQKYPLAAKIERLLLQSHSDLTVGSFVLYSLGYCGGLGFLAIFVTGAFSFGWAGAGAGLCLPFFWLRRKRNKRLDAFQKALPDAVDLMSRALRAGHSIQQSLELIAEQSPAPLCDEFSEVHSHQKFGIPFREALLLMGDRVGSKDLSFVITAILVQKETGGDLIQILERTTEVIRDRGRVEGEIQTYTAQGRLTGWILSALPVVMLAIISVASPSYPTVLFHDPLGQKLLMGGGVMIIIGSMVIRKIVAVEI
jgi:tight adherence protein B